MDIIFYSDYTNSNKLTYAKQIRILYYFKNVRIDDLPPLDLELDHHLPVVHFHKIAYKDSISDCQQEKY